jgi:serine protease
MRPFLLAGVFVLALVLSCQAKQFHIYVRSTNAVPANVTATLMKESVEHDRLGELYLFNSTNSSTIEAALDAMFSRETRDVIHLGSREIIINEVLPVKKHFTAFSWGLDRIDQRSGTLNGMYNPQAGNNGSGVTVWVVDTGVQSMHSEFITNGESRASNPYASYLPADDCDGHGTHVAGTIGGNTFGVARNVQIRGIKVLDCTGSGTTYTVAQGLLYIKAHLTGADVINLSLGYGARDATVEAVLQDLIALGVTVVAAAGNEGANACGHFPSAQIGVISVGATTSSDVRASFSNYGTCVTIMAPGASITSARLGGGSVSMSGTSMASPHVAGTAALMLQQFPGSTGAQVTVAILGRSTQNVISSINGSPNKLLYVLEMAPPTSASPTPSSSRSGTPSRSPSRSTAPSRTPSRTPSQSRRPKGNTTRPNDAVSTVLSVGLLAFCAILSLIV